VPLIHTLQKRARIPNKFILIKIQTTSVGECRNFEFESHTVVLGWPNCGTLTQAKIMQTQDMRKGTMISRYNKLLCVSLESKYLQHNSLFFDVQRFEIFSWVSSDSIIRGLAYINDGPTPGIYEMDCETIRNNFMHSSFPPQITHLSVITVVG